MVRALFILLLLLPAFYGWPQPSDEAASEAPTYAYRGYDFINYEANRLFLPKPGTLNHFFEKLARLENEKRGTVHILHIGDSHLQADYFSGEVRRLFHQDQRFGNAGRGFIFPYSAAHTNNPEDYRTRYTGHWEGFRSVKRNTWSQWGLAGVTAVTHDPRATITIQPRVFRGSFPSPIQEVKIFYPVFDERSFVPRLLTPSSNISRSQIHADGYIAYKLRKPLWEITIGLQRIAPSESRFTMQGIMLENGHPGVLYSVAGANGAEVATYLRCRDLEKHVKALAPDLVIVSLGTNDAYFAGFDDQAYKANYRLLLRQVRQAAPEADILLTTPSDNFRRRRYANRNNDTARKRIMELAQEENLAVWDMYEVMGGYKSMLQWRYYGLAQRDRIHFTYEGYRLQGQLLFEAIDRAYREYWERTASKRIEP